MSKVFGSGVGCLMIYNDEQKKWNYHNNLKSYREFFCKNYTDTGDFVVTDGRDNAVLNITAKLKYNSKGVFHQWRSSRGIFGLKFKTQDEADSFLELVNNMIRKCKESSSISPVASRQHNFSKPSRDSVDADYNSEANNRSTSAAAGPPPPPPPCAPPPPGPPGGRIPPPPAAGAPPQKAAPPPSNSSAQPSQSSGGLSEGLAGALKGVQLKKAAPREENDTSAPSKPASSGGGDMLSEMANILKKRAAKINEPGPAAEPQAKDENPTPSLGFKLKPAGDAAAKTVDPKPFQPSSFKSSPSPSVANLQPKNNFLDSNAPKPSSSSNFTPANNAASSQLDVEKLKTEIIEAFKVELQKLKDEILEEMKK